tara:strand:+ start:680 stop:1069 length:390 start_codon:yes stop_codon:yes gene_type:complete
LKYKDIKISSNRNFGIVFSIVFLIIGLWPLLNDYDLRTWSLIISIIFFVLGLLNSKLLTPFNYTWFRFGIFLGNFISPLIMGFVFFFVVTPTGILMRLFKKDLINLKKNNDKTYWIKKSNKDSNMSNQF